MCANFLANPRWRAVVLTAGGQSYDWIDVFVSAMWRGEWKPFEQHLLEGLACAAIGTDPRGVPLHDREIQEAADRFRYEHRLISSDETIAWLERSGLTTDSWGDYLLRATLRERWRAQVDPLPGGPPLAQLAGIDVAAEGFCSGTFDRFATTFAGRVAIAHASGPAASDSAAIAAPDAIRLDQTLRDHATWLTPLAACMVRARIAHVAQLDHIFDLHAHSATTTSALARQVERHRLAWIRVDLERLAFASAEAAQEAACCVRHDRRCLTEIAIDARQPVRDTRDLLERIEPELHDAVLSAGPGDLVGPIALAARHELIAVLAKRPPDLADPLVHARAAEAVVEQAVSRAMLAHVSWEEPQLSSGTGSRQAVTRRDA